METLNNFASIYCFIAFVLGAVIMLVALAIAAMGKEKEPRNKVRFYVTKGNDYDCHRLVLWMGKPTWNMWDKKAGTWIARSKCVHFICYDIYFDRYNIKLVDFADMKDGEIREVFINLED